MTVKSNSRKWDQLSVSQKSVLFGAWEGESFTSLLNGFSVQTPEAAHWNRKFIHVPTVIAATQYLHGKGLVEVFVGEIENVLDEAAAAEAIATASNWWGYDPDGNWAENYTEPPVDWDPNAAAPADLWLNTTPLGDELIASVTVEQWQQYPGSNF